MYKSKYEDETEIIGDRAWNNHYQLCTNDKLCEYLIDHSYIATTKAKKIAEGIALIHSGLCGLDSWRLESVYKSLPHLFEVGELYHVAYGSPNKSLKRTLEDFEKRKQEEQDEE